MNLIALLYPNLNERRFMPAYYAPLCFGLTLVPFLWQDNRLATTWSFPILLCLCLYHPSFTSGDPSADYFNSSLFMAMPLWYIDFVLLTPRDGEDAPAFIGKIQAKINGENEADVSHNRGQQWNDLRTLHERLMWSIRLMLPAHRGIGWNWQVKGVPTDPYTSLSKWQFIFKQACWSLLFYAESVIAMAVLGLAYDLDNLGEDNPTVKRTVATAVLGWSGAVWVWTRLNCAYCLAAAVTVAIGITESWGWPPLMGPLEAAWSVRQMWRYAHDLKEIQ